MAVGSEIGDPSNPSWFTPKRLLVIFCVINLINYIDRGAIASNGVNGNRQSCTEIGECTGGSGIQGEFDLSNFEDGILSSAFMVGLLVASPIFASLAKSVNPFRLIGVGLSVWTVAVIGCGLSFNFWFITVCRMLVGVGEASFISLAAPFIDDNAPAAQKTAWLGAFYMCIPTGYALGYIYGGVVGMLLTWRWAFGLEAILMLPFAILGFVMKPLQLKGFAPVGSKKALTSNDSESPITDGDEYSADRKFENKSQISSDMTICESKGNQFSRFFADIKELLSNKVYVVNVLGYVAYNFVIGAYSYWGPKAGYYIYQMNNADMIFGAITVVCGIVGSVAGGVILDYVNSTIHNAFKFKAFPVLPGLFFLIFIIDHVASRGSFRPQLPRSLESRLLSVATFLGAIFCFCGFCFKSMTPFIVLFSIGELLVFSTQAPVNHVNLQCVKPSLRPLSMAMSTVAIHIFGDVPSSPLVGVLQDQINDWRSTALILTSILFISAVVWFFGICLRSVGTPEVERAYTTPLLEEKIKDDNY